ncbi:2-C-methyl-D-erythritol 4-phosphate cytidylyltransferase [Spiroplasma turonicum]|uniref:2-C-methyl-D-erythritol 4-phosphate cytidylyltransferase n=1 Tax=Spiroplasma turonicum TaxID=216946 RepID=A0A0K1P4N5_9MOLU|nr:2-C-methyl-D-erythritol 4-phosphate cytidylyltransferase [Spiroplasma turonicum]AKU79265.1 2-C-methyl-D-erythritol 4-phosphate cytidylyltransferase [Spiroplasma turonicum]ALX70288.1 2-C-methyl-D-erythritol 4-phosphate cytidylyltransferase [Spiroplasma turonicum]
MFTVIIVANGGSERFGDENKLLTKIDGDFLINKTINAFKKINEFDQIILVSNDEVFNVIDKNLITYVKGGKTRSLSVMEGLKLVKNNYVMIHDGARPFISKKLVEKIMYYQLKFDAVVPTLPITSCLKKMVNKKITTMNREIYFTTQTPQSFKTELIKNAYNCLDENWLDDIQAVEKIKGIKIKTINGDEKNKKITFKEDIFNYLV